nr:lysozyme [uncultured Cellulosilyticum sp.]
MKISQSGIDLIKSFEGCYLKAYRCPAGVLTIGWGCTVGVKEGQTITQEQADTMLMKELSKFEDCVNKFVTYPINQNQFDALVSFSYNCGAGALKTSTLLQYLNKGKVKEAADQFDLWVNGGGKKLPGLVRRRAAEKALFLKPVSVIVEDKELSKAVSNIIKSGVNIDFNKWKRKDLIKLKDVPYLVCKLAGVECKVLTVEKYKESVNKLIQNGYISDGDTWFNKTYNVENVRSLLLKYSYKIS